MIGQTLSHYRFTAALGTGGSVAATEAAQRHGRQATLNRVHSGDLTRE